MPNADSSDGLDELSQRFVRQYWSFYPTSGSRIGKHEYDGTLPDLTPSSLQRRVRELNEGLTAVSAAGETSLNEEDRLSHSLLDLFLQRELFSLTQARNLETNPMRQVGYLDVSGYLNRDYGPLVDRVRSMTRVLDQVPEFLEVLASHLSDGIGRPVLDSSVESYSGMARFYRVDLGKAGREITDQGIRAEFDRARGQATVALEKFASMLEQRRDRAPEEFAVGPGLYSSMLKAGEALDVPVADLITIGEANLEENLRELREVAAVIGPGRDVREIVEETGARHPSASALIPETRNMLEDIRQSVIDLDLVSVPSEDRCQVVETPTYMRYAFAAMDSAGALEERATESFYYVTPVETDWNAQQQEEWLTNFNYATLRIVSIHEVYPGHFVHHLHNRYGRTLPLINRVASSYAFVEGWAHYAEAMMIEGGYGKERPELRLTQLLEALVRNCRYMCSLGMHTQGMTLDEATRYFIDKAFMAEHPARREALRGAFDPGYLNYTLGKLMILKLRDDYRLEQGSGFMLKEFHDRLLSYGAPALPLLRRAMLRDPAGSPV